MKKICLEGNDGTGKSTIVSLLRERGFSDVSDRGFLSKKTLDETLQENEKDVVYIILECSVQKSLQRLQNAGKDMTEVWHTKESLVYFQKKFREVGKQHKAFFVSSEGDPQETLKHVMSVLEYAHEKN